MDGTTFTGAGGLGTVDPVWKIVGVADFNYDNKPDILWRNSITGNSLVWFMNGMTYTGSVWLGEIDPIWENAGLADFNNDGNIDILWRNSSSGDLLVWFMNGVTFSGAAWLLPSVSDSNWKIVGIADFNNDGKPDILWHDTATGNTIVWYMDGLNYIGLAGFGTVNPVCNIEAVADFNGDGKPDLLWRDTSTGNIIVWLMDGTSFIGSVGLGTVNTAWQIVAP